MFEDADLFLALAETAGVFVGFGALIGVTQRHGFDATELARVRGVVTIGLVVVVATLVPVGLARYGSSAGTLWPISSVVFLVIIWLAILAPLATPALVINVFQAALLLAQIVYAQHDREA